MVVTGTADSSNNAESDERSPTTYTSGLRVELPSEDPESVIELSAIELPPGSEAAPPALPGVDPQWSCHWDPACYTPDCFIHFLRGLYQNHRIHNPLLNRV
jgi:hypothetical protein